LRGATDSGFTAHSFTRSTDARSVVIGPAELLDAKPGFVIAAVSADRRALALLNPDTGAVKVLRVSAEGSTVESKTEWKVPGAYSAAFSPDANRVLVNCSGLGPEAATHRLCLYRTSDGKEERELPALARGEAAWSADGRTAMTSNGTDVSTLWNTDDWKPRCVLRGHLGGDATSFALATDGRTALIVRDGRAHLVSTTDGAVLITLELTDAASFCLGVQPLGAGRFAAVQLDGRLDLLDVAAWQAALAPLGLAW
jgi:WD40 repeat protein